MMSLFVGQDPITKGVLVELIHKLNSSLGLTSVIVSHDVDEVLSIADHVCVVSEGKIIAQGTKKDLVKGVDWLCKSVYQRVTRWSCTVPFSEPYLISTI
jgi:ABC-type transporter Mla maintaining outer membrane lipid asymmetry ATPase subunit MlaF